MRLFSINHRKILSDTYQRLYSNTILKPPWDVLFFGTDNFSLESLKTLHIESQNNTDIIRKLNVVTTTKNSYVKKYAEDHLIPIQHWPLQNPTETCKKFHVGVVVSFGNLIPKTIIEAFPLGMINVHASLLPRWRGAAPIIHALAAGDEKTGVTIMKIQPHKFDIGEIIHQEEVQITKEMKMPELHKLLAKLGAQNLLNVLVNSPEMLNKARNQDSKAATLAPRVNSSMANVIFEEHTAKYLYDLSRALAGLYPLVVNFNGKVVKLHNIVAYRDVIDNDHCYNVGAVVYDKNTKLLHISTKGGCITVDRISLSGKKVMNATEFRNGYLKNTTSQVFSSPVKCK